MHMGRPRTSPPDARGLGLVAVLVITAGAIWKLMANRGNTLAELAPTTSLVAYALVVGAAASVYFHWRLSGGAAEVGWNQRLSGWLVIGLTIGAVHGFLAAFLQQAAPGSAALGVDSWLLVSQLVAAAALVLVTLVCERIDVVRDPALTGFVIGLVLSASTCLAMAVAPGLRFGPTTASLLNTALMLCGLILALTLLQRTLVSLWVRQRLAFAAVALLSAQCTSHLDGPVFSGVAILANTLGALVLCALALHLLRHTLQRHLEQMSDLHSALLEGEVAALEHRELLHELGSTVAGIATASSVIKLPGLSGPPRDRLERMVEAEVARLVRLVSERGVLEPDRDVFVDDVLEPLVVSHQARGLDVDWAPSGLVARGDADDLAEVVNILLENAARHGGGGRVTLSVSADDDTIEIRCSDQGAGISSEVRDRLFESGARRQDSPGQGLGLSIAQRLMSQRGGALQVVDDAPGATFAASLPRIGTSHAALDHVS